ncbi:LysM peptidoglycan-binding domain-containing protein [Lactobacillus johnsonii]|nr:LysM peptidoglycan-binding domain-containing protein [Lactobacillus johnsonii]
MLNFISKFHKRENIDLAFFNDDLDNKIYNLDLLPEVNLTLANVNANTPGSNKVGTWIYTMDCGENSQFLAYDFYGYYTDESYQLSLIDTDYIVQQGDSWYSIARRHDIPLIKLLKMNETSSESRVYEGQVVKIA